ncbi:NYN domain-containing protein [uncultured Selenomonas sp.]|uniref:NYN domain-containing protein n=1 Tax=uncultured Selenomonas sp. TaxID=159275 RepID=UPI0028DBAB01|nr:NYN domain-containing protein [uncultured Selenomonas sp.]
MARQRDSEYYLIDGYNVINAWPELIRLRGNLDEARDVLVHILTEYGAFENYEMTIVFDAFLTEDEEHELQITDRMKVIYTGAGETADSCIERLAYESVRTSREVHVVTSDGAEQSAILGAGAYRISSRELWRRVKKTKKRIADEYLGEVTLPLLRNEVGSRIDSSTAAKLDALRRNRR